MAKKKAVLMDDNGQSYIGDLPAISTLFSQVSTVNVSGTGEQTIKGSIVGTDSLDVSDFAAGKTWIGFQNGTYTTPAITVGNVTLKIYLGTTVILTNVISSLPLNVSSFPYTSHITIVCRSVGATGSIAASGYIEFNTGTSLTTLKLFFPPTVTTIDLSSSRTYNATVQYSSTGNSLTSITHTLLSLN